MEALPPDSLRDQQSSALCEQLYGRSASKGYPAARMIVAGHLTSDSRRHLPVGKGRVWGLQLLRRGEKQSRSWTTRMQENGEGLSHRQQPLLTVGWSLCKDRYVALDRTRTNMPRDYLPYNLHRLLLKHRPFPFPLPSKVESFPTSFPSTFHILTEPLLTNNLETLAHDGRVAT